MDDIHYDIYFRGEILEDFQLNDVKANVAKVFSADEEKINSLFSGKACLLKKAIDKATALKYQSVLKKAGAKIIIKTNQAGEAKSPANQTTIKPTVPTTPTTPTATESEAAAANAAPTTPSPTTPDYNAELMPVGSDVLSESERKTVKAVDVDISGITMTSIFDNPEPPPHNDPPAPDISHISVAEVGSDILPDTVHVEMPFPDVSNLDIAEAGVNLLEETTEIPLLELDLSEFSVAPVGERLVEEDKTPAPAAPDTSHLTLDS